jgi:hypothetical protein
MLTSKHTTSNQSNSMPLPRLEEISFGREKNPTAGFELQSFAPTVDCETCELVIGIS